MKRYNLVFENTETGNKLILESYTSRKQAYARAVAWNELSERNNTHIHVTVKERKSA